jgi:N-acetylmuramoyl-L-alanine amidase
MPARGVTRRSLLVAAAGAVAGGLTRPRGALGALAAHAALGGAPEPRLFERPVGTLPPGGAAVRIDLEHNADLLGVRWSGIAAAGVELRFRDASGQWSRWVSAGTHGHAPEDAPPTGAMVGDPVWTGGTSVVQLRSDRGLSEVRLSCVDVSGGIGAARRALAAGPRALAAALPLATPTLEAGPGQPPIVARRAWAQGIARPRVAPEYGAVRMAFVHHTENPNGYYPGEVPAMLRAIFVFHRYVKGWNDIGYNFVIDLYGRIFEARAGGIDEPVVGAQAGGYNLVSTGVAVLGEFMSTPISEPAARALERLLAWKLSLHGTPTEGRVTVRVDPAGAVYSRFPAGASVSLPRIAGHRDADSTDCPGDDLYGELPSIRRSAHRLAGQPVRATLTLAPLKPGEQGASGGQGTSGEGSPTGATSALSGSVASLGGAPIAGAPVAIQVRGVSERGEVVQERTLAEASTNASGEWSVAVAISPDPGAGMWLRALCPGTTALPATVSEPLHVGRALTPASALAPTPPAAPPPVT